MILRPGGALGDACYVSALPRLLSQQGHEDIVVACEKSAQPIFKHNPYVKGLITTPNNYREPEKVKKWPRRYDRLKKNFSDIYHVHGHVEVKYLYRTDAVWGIPPGAERRKTAGDINYQDETFASIGLPDRGVLPEFYFSKKEEREMVNLREMLDRDGKKLVLWQWDGSSVNKFLVWGPRYLREALEDFPDTVHYVYTKAAAGLIPRDHRVLNALSPKRKSSVRETLQLCKIADLVVGPESFLVNAAAAFDTPKILFLTHSRPVNLAKHFTNCTCIEPLSVVDCHPCYLIHVDFVQTYDPIKRGVAREFAYNCSVWDPKFPYRCLGFKCCYHLPHAKVRESIRAVLTDKGTA